MYEDERSYRLFCRRFFNLEVKSYVRGERALAERLLGGKRVLVEVGCGKGEYMALARRKGLGYVGVDPSAYFIEAARRKAARLNFDLARLICGDACDAGEALIGGARGDTLIVAPFNCIGNMRRPLLFLDLLSRSGADVLISSFDRTFRASKARDDYYRRAGFQSRRRTVKGGVSFRGPKAFHSFAYEADCLEQAALERGIALRKVRFGIVGYALIRSRGNIPT